MYIFSIIRPFSVSPRVIAAVNRIGRQSSEIAGAPASAAPAVKIINPIWLLVSKPSENRKPIT